MDARQSKEWGRFLSGIGWQVRTLARDQQAFVRKIPVFGFSVIKIQRQKNPLSFSKIEALAKNERALFINIEPDIENHLEEKLKKNGFNLSNLILSHTSTTQIDISGSHTNILSSFSENARRNIRKAQKFNLKLEFIYMRKEKDDTRYKQFYQMAQNLAKSKKFYLPSYFEFHQKMMAFKKSSVLIFAYEKGNPKPIAVVWMAGFSTLALYMQTGITDRGYQLLANYQLVWEAIKLYKKLGYKRLDFEGIFDPRFPKERKKWLGFTEFKKRFHGSVLEYPPSYIKIYNPFFKVLYLMSKILP